MWNMEKVTLVTNNDRVYRKYKDDMEVILLDSYRDVLIKVRDLVYDRHILLTHPRLWYTRKGRKIIRKISC